MAERYRERILRGSGISSKKVQSEYAKKLMQKMGWSEGKGLGKKQTGSVECLQIKRREDGQGLGIKSNSDEAFDWKDQWWNNAYNDSIKKLKIVVPNKKKQQQQSDSSSSSSSSDDSSSSSSEPPVLKTRQIKKKSKHTHSEQHKPKH